MNVIASSLIAFPYLTDRKLKAAKKVSESTQQTLPESNEQAGESTQHEIEDIRPIANDVWAHGYSPMNNIEDNQAGEGTQQTSQPPLEELQQIVDDAWISYYDRSSSGNNGEDEQWTEVTTRKYGRI